mmetsp:Transcript_5887/g.14667  ORF Transcript_5887/g.14667 Transcript_5887/m.14667 type:complete len:245 (+) Transcript_5887:38-772(+)
MLSTLGFPPPPPRKEISRWRARNESARCTCGARRYAAPGRSRARGVGSGGPVGLLVRWSCRAAKEPRDARTDAAERLCFNPLSRRRNRSLGLDRMTDRSVSTVRPAAPRSYRTPIRGTDVVRSFVRIRNDRAGMIPISCCCRGGMGDFVVRRSDISSSAHDLVASVTGPRGPVPAVVGVAASRGGKAVDGRAARRRTVDRTTARRRRRRPVRRVVDNRTTTSSTKPSGRTPTPASPGDSSGAWR